MSKKNANTIEKFDCEKKNSNDLKHLKKTLIYDVTHQF